MRRSDLALRLLQSPLASRVHDLRLVNALANCVVNEFERDELDGGPAEGLGL